MKRKIKAAQAEAWRAAVYPYRTGWLDLLAGWLRHRDFVQAKLRVYENGVSGYVDGRPAVARFDWGRGCGVRGTWLRRGLLPGASGSIL